MKVLILSAALLGLSQAQPFYDATECRRVEPLVPEDCDKTTQICCAFQGEACTDAPCPTDPPTKEPTPGPTKFPTPGPTKFPTPGPTEMPTPSPSPSPISPNPTPGPTEEVCYCPTPAPITPTTPMPTYKKSKKSKSSGGGMGIGDCDCDKNYKLREIRFKYSGAARNVKMSVYSDGKSGSYPYQSEVCRFSGVNPGDELICDIRAGSNLLAFENETPFVVTGANGYECVGQYHTSCSSDIVLVPAQQVSGFALCSDIIVTGWRDGNPLTNDCDDGEEPCSCDTIVRDTSTSTTFTPTFVDVNIGKVCYCDTQGQITTPTPAPTVAYKKKKKKKGKKGSSGGLGYGDCDCDKTFGMTMLRYLWQGKDAVDITYLDKSGNKLCEDKDVQEGEESECNLLDPLTCKPVGSVARFSTNTYMQVKLAGTNNAYCSAEVHTSCSSDIVGGYGDGGCGTDLMVSAWSDGANCGNNLCDDGYDVCPCEGEEVVIIDPADSENPVEEINYDEEPDDLTYIPDVCFCSTIDETKDATIDDAPDAPITKTRNAGNGFGYGDCDCENGFKQIEFVYKGTGIVSLSLYTWPFALKKRPFESLDTEQICTFTNVQFGDELSCSVTDGPLDPDDGSQRYARLTRNTFVKVTDADGNEEIGRLRTGRYSCRDIVGWGFTGYPDVVITGWTDYADNECNDGFEPCECGDCNADYTRTECNKQNNCYFDEAKQECAASSVGFYQRTNGANYASYTFAVVLGIFAVLAF